MSAFDEDLPESMEDAFEDIESDESDESDEAARSRRRGRRRAPTAPGSGLFKRRPSSGGSANYVTQVQLQAALARVGEQIKTNSKAIKAVESRAADAAAAAKKETADRKKEVADLRRDVTQKLELLTLLPLLMRPPTVEVSGEVGGIPKGTQLLTQSNDTLSSLLPMLLLGGLGSSSGSSSSSGSGGLMSGDGLGPMMLVLAATGGLNSKK